MRLGLILVLGRNRAHELLRERLRRPRCERTVGRCPEALAVARRLRHPGLREGFDIGLELGIRVLGGQSANLLDAQGLDVMKLVGAGQNVLQRHDPTVLGVVLHRDQVLDVQVTGLAKQAPTAFIGRVEQRRDHPVTLMKVGLPSDQVILVDPRDVPDSGTRQRHGRVSGLGGSQPVLGVVPLDEHRQ